jgi:hypothetical protein
MVSREDTKQARVVADAQAVPELGYNQATTTKEKISAYFTIAAAAFGLISDGCKCPPTGHQESSDVLRTDDTKMTKIRTTL